MISALFSVPQSLRDSGIKKSVKKTFGRNLSSESGFVSCAPTRLVPDFKVSGISHKAS